jgi:hypothetical protein
VPADWFYEWKKLDEKTKQPYAIAMVEQGGCVHSASSVHLLRQNVHTPFDRGF